MAKIDRNKAIFCQFSTFGFLTVLVAIREAAEVNLTELQRAFTYAFTNAQLKPDTDEEYVHYALKRIGLSKKDYEILEVHKID